MKKILALLVFATILVGCEHGVSTELNLNSSKENESTVEISNEKVEQTENGFSSEGDFFETRNNEATVISDNNTGCKYLVVSQYYSGYGTSVTPLLKQDGTPDCGTKEI